MSASKRHAAQQKLAANQTPAPTEPVEDVAGPLQTGRNFTIKELVFPATILRFARQGTAYELLTFRSQPQVVEYIANTAGVYRWIKSLNVETIAKSLDEVPTPILLAIFNRTRGDKPLDRFRDRESAETRTAEVLMNVSVQYEDTDMAKKAATGQTKTEANAEAKAATKKAKAEEKAAAAAAAKEQSAAKRADGVIGTIKSFLDSENGATQGEILDSLVEKFPTRQRDGMSSTVKIQCSRLAKSTGRAIVSKNIQGRGRVYKFADKGAIPGVEVVQESAPAKAPEATPANAPAPAAEVATASA